MKKAIVLLMTIGFITVISALVLISLSISEKSFQKVSYLSSQNQFSILFKDFVNLLNENSKKIKNRAELDLFLTYSNFSTVEPKSGVEIGLFTENQMGKLNINHILQKMKSNSKDIEYLERPLRNYFALFDLREPQLLLDLLNDTLDEAKDGEHDMERGAYTEIASDDFDFREGKIYSFNHLKRIFDRYYEVSQDPNIYRVEKENFEERFYFGDLNTSNQFLDCQELDSSMASKLILGNYTTLNSICQDINTTQNMDFKNIVKIYNIADFNKSSQYFIKCSIIFNTDSFKREVHFNYNVKNQEIVDIDTNFQEQ